MNAIQKHSKFVINQSRAVYRAGEATGPTRKQRRGLGSAARSGSTSVTPTVTMSAYEPAMNFNSLKPPRNCQASQSGRVRGTKQRWGGTVHTPRFRCASLTIEFSSRVKYRLPSSPAMPYCPASDQ